MKITQSGFYDMKDFKEDISNIEISSGLEVFIFYAHNNSINLHIGENSKLELFCLLDEEQKAHTVRVIQDYKNSILFLRSIILSKNSQKIDTKIISEISSNNSKSDVQILSIAGENGDISLDGIIDIHAGIQGVEARLQEDNLFLGNSGKINGIPTLLVKSNDVKASHSCKMEKISDEKLFYLRSRGIGKDNAMNMILEGYINHIFAHLKEKKQTLFERVFQNITEKLK